MKRVSPRRGHYSLLEVQKRPYRKVPRLLMGSRGRDREAPSTPSARQPRPAPVSATLVKAAVGRTARRTGAGPKRLKALQMRRGRAAMKRASTRRGCHSLLEVQKRPYRRVPRLLMGSRGRDREAPSTPSARQPRPASVSATLATGRRRTNRATHQGRTQTAECAADAPRKGRHATRSDAKRVLVTPRGSETSLSQSAAAANRLEGARPQGAIDAVDPAAPASPR